MKTFGAILVAASAAAFAIAPEPDGLTLSPGFHASVVAEGVFEELHGLAAARALALLTRRFISRTGRSRPKRRPTGRTVAFRIRVERMTGREVTR